MSREDKIYDFLRKTLFLEIVVLVLIVSGCYPPAATMQDARMAGDGGARFTGYWYGLEDAGAGGEKIANVYGGLLGIGSSDRTEIQFRLDHFAFVDADDDDSGQNFFSIGPKLGLSEDRLALLVPLGTYASNGVAWEMIQIHPTLLASVPLGRELKLTAAAKLMFPFDQDYLTWLGASAGVGLSSNFDRWIVLPEVSYTICLDEDEVDPVWTYGVALVLLARP